MIEFIQTECNKYGRERTKLYEPGLVWWQRQSLTVTILAKNGRRRGFDIIFHIYYVLILGYKIMKANKHAQQQRRRKAICGFYSHIQRLTKLSGLNGNNHNRLPIMQIDMNRQMIRICGISLCYRRCRYSRWALNESETFYFPNLCGSKRLRIRL